MCSNTMPSYISTTGIIDVALAPSAKSTVDTVKEKKNEVKSWDFSRRIGGKKTDSEQKRRRNLTAAVLDQ